MNENTKIGKSHIFWEIILVVYLFAAFIFMICFHVNEENHTVLVRQFGKTVKTIEDKGIYFTNPFQDEISIYGGERMYDFPVTPVITSDKKTMEADAWATWKVSNAQNFYKELSSAEAAVGRMSSNVYSSMKKVISSTSQDDVIRGKDGSLSSNILNDVTRLNKYGITITSFDIKGLDLPKENRESVYLRMISEREAISAAYIADGDKSYNMSRAETDALARTTKSDAKVKAATIEADAEKQYYDILRKAYSSSSEKQEFYKYWIGLETLKDSLKNGGTVQITDKDPLHDILINAGK